ncbi:phage-related baseplate assembly protein V [Stappia sp. 22II-S9-Z10]|nr:phage-related baseplate assembly protein V [Stappia sp. 22II-S9-Z10]
MSAIPSTLEDVLGQILFKLADDERRNRGRVRMGTIEEVDAEKGLARVKLGEQGEYPPLLSPWIRWKEQAMGDMRTHFPPSKGQQVRVVSQNGEIADAEIDLSIPQDSIERPSSSGSEYVLADVGGTRIVVSDGKIVIKTGAIEIEADSWVANVPSVDWNG